MSQPWGCSLALWEVPGCLQLLLMEHYGQFVIPPLCPSFPPKYSAQKNWHQQFTWYSYETRGWEVIKAPGPFPKMPTDAGDELNCRGDLSPSSSCVFSLRLPVRCNIVLQRCSPGKFGERLGQAQGSGLQLWGAVLLLPIGISGCSSALPISFGISPPCSPWGALPWVGRTKFWRSLKLLAIFGVFWRRGRWVPRGWWILSSRNWMMSHKALSFPQLILQPSAVLCSFFFFLRPARTNSPCAVGLGWLMSLDCSGPTGVRKWRRPKTMENCGGKKKRHFWFGQGRESCRAGELCLETGRLCPSLWLTRSCAWRTG